MVSKDNKRVQISLDYVTLQLLDDFAWSGKMTKSEFVKMLILEHSQKEKETNDTRENNG